MFVLFVTNTYQIYYKMHTNLKKVKELYLQHGDVPELAKELNCSPSLIRHVISGRRQNRDITLAVLRKAEQRKQESEEIERLQNSL